MRKLYFIGILFSAVAVFSGCNGQSQDVLEEEAIESQEDFDALHERMVYEGLSSSSRARVDSIRQTPEFAAYQAACFALFDKTFRYANTLSDEEYEAYCDNKIPSDTVMKYAQAEEEYAAFGDALDKMYKLMEERGFTTHEITAVDILSMIGYQGTQPKIRHPEKLVRR